MLLLVGVVLLHKHYCQIQRNLEQYIQQAEDHARIEEESGEIILSLNKICASQAQEQLRLNKELRTLFLETVRTMVASLEQRDEYTQNHSLRVAGWSAMLARFAGLSEEDIETIERAALLHDIGKLSIPDEILHKPSALTPEEFAVVKEHPDRGEHIVKHIKLLTPTRDVIRHHHERLDGKGYPDGLTDLSQLVNIASIADCFDAMTSDRPYREPMPYSVAKEKMLAVAGQQFDAELTETFFEMIETTGEGYRSIYHVEGIPSPRYIKENEQRLETEHGSAEEPE